MAYFGGLRETNVTVVTAHHEWVACAVRTFMAWLTDADFLLVG